MPDSIQIGLLVLGAVLLLIAILGGNFKLFGAEVTATVSNRFLRFTAFALGTALLVIAIAPIVSELNALPEQTQSANGGSSTESTPEASLGGLSACQVTIRNPLVSLMSEPDTFSQELIRVPPGEYAPLEYETTTFGPQQQGWFMIEAEGRQGWIKDNTWTIERKSAQCP